ncbi:methyltransferase [Actinophytocola sp.]|uniref:methyltransferase n=1 Tax=Actinophytocola sp. TaxID=1872138 RepID=UPI0038999339
MDDTGAGRFSTENEAAAFILDEIVGYMYAAALRAAAATNLADHLRDGPRTADELAELTGYAASAIHRVLRLLATKGVFSEQEPGRFRLTPPAAALCTTAPISVRAAVLMMTEPAMWRSAGEIVESTRDATPSFDRVFGMPMFEYYARDPQAVAGFHDGMAAWSDVENGPVAAACDIPPGATVVDVGGGQGGLLLEVLRANPATRGVLFDQAHVLGGNRLTAAADLADRWQPVAGDFLDAVPPGDVLLVKRIMHDWDDPTCVRILRNCRAAVRDGGRILVFDAVLPAGDVPHQAKALDLLMMTVLPGHERTEAQFRRLFAAAELSLVSITDVHAMPVSILHAVPA